MDKAYATHADDEHVGNDYYNDDADDDHDNNNDIHGEVLMIYR